MAEDDLEEMRGLRKQFQRSVGPSRNTVRSGRDAGSDDDDGEASGADASASAATAESQYKFGTTLTSTSTAAPAKKAIDDEETDAMAQVMGFSGFASGNRKSRTFDIDSLVSDAKKNASQSSKKKDSDDSDDDNSPSVKAKPKTVLSVPRGPTSGPSLAPGDSGTESDIGPPLPPSFGQEAGTSASGISSDLMDSDSDFSDTEDAPDDTSADWKIPCAYDLTFEHGDKAVTALAIDPAGARFATGGLDYEVKLWDFGGMQANLNSFRTTKPVESHAIINLSFDNSGEQILVVSGSAQATIIGRDGFKVLECPKGFQFIRDMTHTKGHISMLTSGSFNPKVKGDFCTASFDESLRIWNVETAKEAHKACLKAKGAKGRLTVPTTCAYSKDAKFIAVGCRDGSIQMWDTTKNNFVSPAKIIRDAHKNDITCVCFSYDSKMICSRGMDDTLKLWDLTMLKKPVFEITGLASLSTQADCLFSPNDKLIVTGTAVKKGEGQSKLVFYDRATGQLVKEIPVADSSVMRMAWHPKLNQIFATTAEGAVKVFFDPNMSHNGALLCRTSKKRRAKPTDSVTSDYIITPFALPLFKEEKQRSQHAQFEKNRKDPVKSHKPEIPMNGPGMGGRVTNAGGTLSSYLVRKLGYATKRVDEDLNPREALLRHAKEAAENPYWVSPAYAKTQPKTIFRTAEEDEGGDQSASKRAKH